MIGNESIDLGLENIWKTWFVFRSGKKLSQEFHEFQYNLEENLYRLFEDLNNGAYGHGGYRTFIVAENKKREISVAAIRDRVVHRLIYDYLNRLYDQTFIYDSWSCRLNKGLIGAIERTRQFFRAYPGNFVWKADIRKFFDNVNHDVLLTILARRVKNEKTYDLIEKIIRSFSKEKGKAIGMPIGNVTSQIFANIYLNELDRFVKHDIKPKAYLRYGDDFILVHNDFEKLVFMRHTVGQLLKENLKLQLHPQNDLIIKVKHGLKFLGVILYPNGRKLNARNIARLRSRLNLRNAGSYFGLVQKHGNVKILKQFQWRLLELSNLEFGRQVIRNS